MQYSRDKLGLRYPRKIVMRDRMPRGPGGKILKNDIIASSPTRLRGRGHA
jgi:hypothetical protein